MWLGTSPFPSGDLFPISNMGWMWAVGEGWLLRPRSALGSTPQVPQGSPGPHGLSGCVPGLRPSSLGLVRSHHGALESIAIAAQFLWLWVFHLSSNQLWVSWGWQVLLPPLIPLGGIHLSWLNEWCFECCPRNVGWIIQYLSPASSLPETSATGHPGDWAPCHSSSQ